MLAELLAKRGVINGYERSMLVKQKVLLSSRLVAWRESATHLVHGDTIVRIEEVRGSTPRSSTTTPKVICRTLASCGR